MALHRRGNVQPAPDPLANVLPATGRHSKRPRMTTATPQQPVGRALPGWATRPPPPRAPMSGAYCRLEPLDADRHGKDLYAAFSQAPDGSDWTYTYAGPFDDEA